MILLMMSSKNIFSALRLLSWLSYLFLDTSPAGEPPCRPWAAALSTTAVRALWRQSRAGGWQRRRADPGLNRRGNSITLGGGPCSAGRGSGKETGDSGCACKAFTCGH